MNNSRWNVLVGLVVLSAPTTLHAADVFELTSGAFRDGAITDRRHAAKCSPRNCDGENISPAMSWSNVPDGTKSFAHVAVDDVGRFGQGVIHWV